MQTVPRGPRVTEDQLARLAELCSRFFSWLRGALQGFFCWCNSSRVRAEGWAGAPLAYPPPGLVSLLTVLSNVTGILCHLFQFIIMGVKCYVRNQTLQLLLLSLL